MTSPRKKKWPWHHIRHGQAVGPCSSPPLAPPPSWPTVELHILTSRCQLHFWCFIVVSNEIFMQYSESLGKLNRPKKCSIFSFKSAPWPFPLPSRQLLPLVWPQPLRRFWEPWVRGRCVNVASLEVSQLPLTQQSGSMRNESHSTLHTSKKIAGSKIPDVNIEDLDKIQPCMIFLRFA